MDREVAGGVAAWLPRRGPCWRWPSVPSACRRTVARIDARNPASGAVLRRLGMRQEAVLVENEWFKGAWSTEVDFALLEREWRAQGG